MGIDLDRNIIGYTTEEDIADGFYENGFIGVKKEMDETYYREVYFAKEEFYSQFNEIDPDEYLDLFERGEILDINGYTIGKKPENKINKDEVSPKTDESPKEKFHSLLDTLHLPLYDQDFLKASYSDEEKYTITFISQDDNKTYQANYKGGVLERLTPENTKLEENIKEKNDLSKMVVLDASNSLVDLSQSISQRLVQPNINKASELVLELPKHLPKSSTTVQDQKKLNDFNNKIDQFISEQKELVNTCEGYLDKTDLIKKQSNEPNRQEFLLKIDEINNQYEKAIKNLNELEELKSLTNVLSNINFQHVRENGLFSELYSENLQNVGMVSALDPKIPFQRGFEQRMQEVFAKEGASVALGVALEHQVSNPKDQITLHLMNYKNIQEFTSKPFQELDKKTTDKLREYSYSSLEKALSIVNEELTKNHGKPMKITRDIVVDPKEKENKNKSYEKLYSKLRPVVMLDDKEINLSNIQEIASNYGSSVEDQWNKESVKLIDNYIVNTNYSAKDGYVSLYDTIQNIQTLAMAGAKRTGIQSDELLSNLEVVHDMSEALVKDIDHLKKHDASQKEIQEVERMVSFLDSYHNHISANVLNKKEQNQIVQEVTGRSDYSELVERIAVLEKQLKEKEQGNNLIGSVKNSIKKEFEKVNKVINEFREKVDKVKTDISEFSFKKSAYKIANSALTTLDNKVVGIKEKIQKELENENKQHEENKNIQENKETSKEKEVLKQEVDIER
ncbi:hypothetical protein [Bacillus safensis]|uniref:hypothetical protein n=1 Tax=Bacillus safensis TaxID=561879 RepID=UPI003670AE09